MNVADCLTLDVYNHNNIERVRQDEEIARKKEEAEEARMQQEDAERRMMELRKRAVERQPGSGGEEIAEQGIPGEGGPSQRMQILDNVSHAPKTREHGPYQVDDSALLPSIPRRREGTLIDPQVHSSLTDESGHINFFLENSFRSRGQSSRDKNQEHEKEKKEQEAKIAEQFTMALGKPADELKPWYVTLNKISEKQERKTEKQLGVAKRRDERFKDKNDPMVMMKKGVRQLKDLEEDRKKVQTEQGSELDRLRIEQDDLEGFSLDAQDGKQDCSIHYGRLSDIGKRHRPRRSRSRERRSTKHSYRRRSRSPVSELDDRDRQSGEFYKVRRNRQTQEHESEHTRKLRRHRSRHRDQQ